MKNILIWIWVFIPGILYAQSYKLSGKLTNSSPASKAYLSYYYNNKLVIDSNFLDKGHFEFHVNIEYPLAATLTIIHDENKISYIKHRDDIKIYLEPSNMEMIEVDSIKRSYVKNSQLNLENRELIKQTQPVENQINQILINSRTASDVEKKSKSFQQGIYKQTELLVQQLDSIRTDFIMKHPNSFVSLDAIKNIAGAVINDLDKVLKLFNSLSPGVKNSIPGKLFGQKLLVQSNIAIGKIAPDFEQADTSGHQVRLSALRGKYVLIDFWASWCVPCRAENPNLVECYKKYHAKGFEILGISLDRQDKKDAWIKAIHDDHLLWPQLSDLKFTKNEVALAYGIFAIPQNFLIDPQGYIIGKDLRGEALEAALKRIVQE